MLIKFDILRPVAAIYHRSVKLYVIKFLIPLDKLPHESALPGESLQNPVNFQDCCCRCCRRHTAAEAVPSSPFCFSASFRCWHFVFFVVPCARYLAHWGFSCSCSYGNQHYITRLALWAIFFSLPGADVRKKTVTESSYNLTGAETILNVRAQKQHWFLYCLCVKHFYDSSYRALQCVFPSQTVYNKFATKSPLSALFHLYLCWRVAAEWRFVWNTH